MHDEEKTKGQLINKLVELHQGVVRIKASDSRKNHAEELLQAHLKQVDTTLNSMNTKIPLTDGPLVYMEIAADITELKPAEEKPHTVQKALVDVIEHFPDAAFIVDRDRKVIAWNLAMEEMTGVPKEKIIGKGDYTYGVPFYGKARPILVDLVFSNAQEIQRKYEYVERKGKTLYAEANNIPLPFGDRRKEACLWGAASPLYDSKRNLIGAIETIRDITEKRLVREKLRQSEKLLQKVFNAIPNIIAILSLGEKRFLNVNNSFIDFGFNREEVIGKTITEVNIWANPREPVRIEKLIKKEGSIRNLEVNFRMKSGEIRVGLLSAEVFESADGKKCLLAVVNDITERKQVTDLFKTLTNSSPIGIYIVQNGKFHFVNPQFQKYTGYSEDELLGKNSLDLVVLADRKMVRENAIKMLKGQRPTPCEYRVVRKSGEIRWVMETVAPIQYQGSRAVLGNYIDISWRKRTEEQLKYLSLRDPLTGLYNRTYFEQEMLRLGKGRCASVGIIICDVDGLKLVNDTLGHSRGDTLLMDAARIIREAFRESDMVARIGGDEFAILLHPCGKTTIEDASRRIKNAVTKYNSLTPGLPLSISVGCAISGETFINIDDLFKEADNNMYREKLHHKQSSRSTIVQALMKTLEERDLRTQDHSERLQDMVVDLALAIGLPEYKLADLRLLAQFHDIGKVGVADRILLKPSPLSAEEFTEIQRHCEIGYRIAQSAADLLHIADWILKHHEWWNGKGYPLGLKGEAIPLECRILAIADAYDAMTSDRPYRKAATHMEAVKELRKYAGIQFDPQLVDIFFTLYLEDNMAFRTGAIAPCACR